MHTHSGGMEGYGHGLTWGRARSSSSGRSCGGVHVPWAGGTAGAWASLTASWHSSEADSAEWSPSSACRRGSRRGHSQSSGSAAPAAQTPAPTASVSPAGPRVGLAAASGAAVPAGSRSGPGLGLGGCPASLQRGREPPCEPAPRRPQEPAQPKPSRVLTTHDPPGK